ncbi:tRNA (N(6)-L-threonylcarbamoyladenosine(37)-C(2))-methylthiotransferase MtaB, partial [Thermodesulfobacteriota bacterium]
PLELSGHKKNYQKGIQYLKEQGIKVKSIGHDIRRDDEICFQCGVCTAVCPTGALNIKRPEMEVLFDRERCSAFQICNGTIILHINTGACLSKRFYIVTLGCKVNHYETASLKEKLISNKWQPVESVTEADIAVINTCIVTRKASYQSRQAIRKIIRENPSAIIAVTGCYPQVFPEELSNIKEIKIFAGNSDKARLPDILEHHLDSRANHFFTNDFSDDMSFENMPVKNFLNRARAFLKIQDGCNSFCSYCIVPYARGPIRSMEPGHIIDSLKTYEKEGYREIVLTGIHLGKYGKDFSEEFDIKDLLKKIGRTKPGFRIRLSSLEPKEIDTELIEMMASEEWLCRHFHIPLQSGDKTILKKMNRHYSPDFFRKMIMKIHEKIPLASIGVDIIAGFPGEDNRSFNNSYSLIDDLPVSYLHVFPYSSRKGTPAAGFPGQVDQKTIKERAKILRDLGREKKKIFYNSCLRQNFTVIVEGWESEERKMVKGLSDNYLKILFPCDHLSKNRIFEVTTEKTHKDFIFGK